MSKYLVPVEIVGIEHHTMRTLRPLLYIADGSDGSEIDIFGKIRSSPLLKQDVRPSIILYHLLMWRCPEGIKAPHIKKGMTQIQYIQWMNEQSELDIWQEMKSTLEDYVRKFSGSHDSAECETLISLGEDMMSVYKGSGT